MEMVEDISNEEILLSTINNGLNLKIFILKDCFYLCSNHIILDGITLMEYANKIFDKEVFIKKPKKVGYIPIISDLISSRGD